MIGSAYMLSAIDPAGWFGTDWRFANPQWLMLAWAGPAMAIVIVFFASRTAHIQERIADEAMMKSLAGARRRWNSWVHAVLSMVAVITLAVALSGPESDPQEVELDTRGRDVVFLVDVSRSMLATDVAPNRLEKAKLWINDLVDELGNDRVGLVAFAGSATVLSPLTTDRMFFRLALEELSPKSVLIGGTNIGDAIRKSMDMVFADVSEDDHANFRDIVLISDGEDQESLPVEAARAAGASGVRIIAIGIGSDKGTLIPQAKGSAGRSSKQVVSKLESGTLRTIAAASPGGVYLEVGTGTIDLAQVYHDLISSADQRTIETTSSVQYTERFMIFLAIGVGLIVLDMVLIPVGSRRALG